MNQIEAYIREQAMARGMDPDRIVAAIKTEGGVNDPYRRAEYVKANGYREPSYGPMQLLVGGDGTGFPTGLGNKMIEDTGVDPRQDWQAGIRYGLDTVKNEGWRQWYGPKKAGYDRWYGVNANDATRAAYTQPVVTSPVAVQKAPDVYQGIASLPTVKDAQAVPQQMPTTTAAPTETAPASPFSGIFNTMLQSSMAANQMHQQAVAQQDPVFRRTEPVDVAATSQTPNVYYEELLRYE